MIAVKLWGGLGNQLFQYAFGKSRALSEQEDLFFYSIPFLQKKDPSLLENFRIDIKYLDESQIGRFYYFADKKLASRVERKAILCFPSVNRKVLVEPGLRYHEPERSQATCFDGYWQSFRYFTSCKDALINELVLRNPQDLPESISAEIKNCNSVSVHIRRGDYLSKANRNIFYRCGIDYYHRAVSFIKKTIPDPVFYVFSDDLFWAKESFNFLNNSEVRFVEHSSASSPNVDMILMSTCRHNIITNSTFSWWGAYININPDKVVIAPEHWYQKKISYSTEDLIPAGWKQM